MKMQYPSGPAGRGHFGNRISGGLPNEPAEGASNDPLVGKRVRTRWPDDNSFYDAVITDYNPVEVYLTRGDSRLCLKLYVFTLSPYAFPGSTFSCL